MKISDAINILNIKNYNITNIQHISYDELKKQYHIQSLIYHPDKNRVIVLLVFVVEKSFFPSC
jgi:curved DNA-binding protein CbpA